MTWKRFDTFTYICDWPGCESDVMDPSDYGGMDREGVAVALDDCDWWQGKGDRSWFCNAHPATWAGDHEDGEPYPPPPYLLIHDGDTDDRDDDGKVSLIHPGQCSCGWTQREWPRDDCENCGRLMKAAR